MKKTVSLLMIMIMLCCGGFALTGCTSDDDSSSGTLEDYDYNDDGEMSDNEFQDATNDYMDENGY